MFDCPQNVEESSMAVNGVDDSADGVNMVDDFFDGRSVCSDSRPTPASTWRAVKISQASVR